jgi:coenzyme F420-reducing hydrogenase beta subunit
MIQNSEGFFYPEIIDMGRCSCCKLCVKICPINKADNYPKSYALINNDEKIRRNSSSGGAFYVMAEEIIRQGGIVFGAMFDNDFSVVHGFAENIAGIELFSGSKYVQSDIGENFKICKRYLDEKRQVLFSGTPCQIDGLKAYLQKEYDNLLCIDIICHGVPSSKVWKKYLDYQETKNNMKPKGIYFRKKTLGWQKLSMLIEYPNNNQYIKSADKDLYYRAFLTNVCLRKSCYRCRYVSMDRQSDITIADFWGVNHVCPGMFDNKGTSLVIVHSNKGDQIFDNIRNKCTIKSIDTNLAIKNNRQAYDSIHKNREKYFECLNVLPFNELDKKLVRDRLIIRIYKSLRICFNEIRRIIIKYGHFA